MAIKLDVAKYECSYCGKIYSSPSHADSCRDHHDLIYVQIAREDLMRLIQYIYTQEPNLITPNIVRRLRRYAKLKGSPTEDKDLSSVLEDDTDGGEGFLVGR